MASVKGIEILLWERIEEIFNLFPVRYNNIEIAAGTYISLLCGVCIFTVSGPIHIIIVL